MNLLGNHYPERLGLAFMVDPPFYFTVFWKAVSPFIPPSTQKKVIFVKGDLEDKRKVFAPYIDLDHLEVDYGGSVQFKWNIEVLWPQEIACFEEKQRGRARLVSQPNTV